jgi:hypothetical protein
MHQREAGTTRRARFTPTTLCNLLLALATACPDAATPPMLSRVWAIWADYLLPQTSPGHAATGAWAARRLQERPPPRLVSGWCGQVLAAADEASLLHVAQLLLHSREGAWLVEPQQVYALLAVLLNRQAGEVAQLQRQQQQHEGEQQQQQQQGSSSEASQRLYGRANHRLKACLAASAAAAAWAEVLTPRQRAAALWLCRQFADALHASRRHELQAHVQRLSAAAKTSVR